MKRLSFFILLFCTLLLSGCGFGPSQNSTYKETDLIGRWQAPSESDIMPEGQSQYLVFLADRDSTLQYRYGYMWDMGDHYDWDTETGTYEDFLLTEEYHGNGWFKWTLTDKNLVEYHFMSEGWAEIPKSYTITVLTETTLTYQDDFKKSHTFSKIER